MQEGYAAIGRAVVTAQMFETALVPIYEIFKIHAEPDYREQTGGHVREEMFKLPVTAIVKALANKGGIAPDLESRLQKYAADRHTLIHRWVREHGWPDDRDVDGFRPIVALAADVQQQAVDLTRLLVGYVLKYADPDWAREHMSEYRERMASLFHRAHLEE